MRAHQVQAGIAHGLLHFRGAVIVVTGRLYLAKAYRANLLERAVVILWQKLADRIELKPQRYMQGLGVRLAAVQKRRTIDEGSGTGFNKISP